MLLKTSPSKTNALNTSLSLAAFYLLLCLSMLLLIRVFFSRMNLKTAVLLAASLITVTSIILVLSTVFLAILFLMRMSGKHLKQSTQNS